MKLYTLHYSIIGLDYNWILGVRYRTYNFLLCKQTHVMILFIKDFYARKVPYDYYFKQLDDIPCKRRNQTFNMIQCYKKWTMFYFVFFVHTLSAIFLDFFLSIFFFKNWNKNTTAWRWYIAGYREKITFF